MTILNERLAETQKITKEQRNNLQALYEGLNTLIHKANIDENLQENGKWYASEMSQLELNLQHNWNFPLNENFHTWWNTFSACTCPKMDNEGRFGFDKIYSDDCPFHGK